MFGVNDPAIAAAVRLYVKLLRADRAVQARVERSLAPRGLTPTQLGVLEALLHKGNLTHRDLGRKVLTSAGNMTDVIDKLAARGLVTRVRDRCDRRQVHVALTEAGQTLIQGVFPCHAADIAAALSGLSACEQHRLGELLRKLGQTAAGPCERAMGALDTDQ